MSSVIKWGAEGLSSPRGAQTSILLREAALDSRLEALRDVALNLLNEVESLQRAQPPHPDRKLSLHDEVRQFEIDLIRTTLDRTNGNQTRAARLLGVNLTTLNTKIKRLKISFAGHEAVVDDDVQSRILQDAN
jgi:transcriptional regulator with GAF, ATPase, and Fis domain